MTPEEIKLMQDKIYKASALAVEGLLTDGSHHKQWYLEQILLALGISQNDIDKVGFVKGVAP